MGMVSPNVVTAALIKDGAVINRILVDISKNDFVPPNGMDMVYPAERINIGDLYDGVRFYKKVSLQIDIDDEEDLIHTIIAKVGSDTPDTQVAFFVDDVEIGEVPLTDGVAEVALEFELPGEYTVKVVTEHHGEASTEVVVE